MKNSPRKHDIFVLSFSAVSHSKGTWKPTSDGVVNFPVKFNQFLPGYIADPETRVCFSCLKSVTVLFGTCIHLTVLLYYDDGLRMLVEDVYTDKTTDRRSTFCFKTQGIWLRLLFYPAFHLSRYPMIISGWLYRINKGLPWSFYLFIM